MKTQKLTSWVEFKPFIIGVNEIRKFKILLVLYQGEVIEFLDLKYFQDDVELTVSDNDDDYLIDDSEFKVTINNWTYRSKKVNPKYSEFIGEGMYILRDEVYHNFFINGGEIVVQFNEE